CTRGRGGAGLRGVRPRSCWGAGREGRGGAGPPLGPPRVGPREGAPAADIGQLPARPRISREDAGAPRRAEPPAQPDDGEVTRTDSPVVADIDYDAPGKRYGRLGIPRSTNDSGWAGLSGPIVWGAPRT